ncbi:MAG: sensor histidine kinase [Caulobacterales bacterium]|nr:sensor histidine kinase [Caulobacterales bacterium]
MRRWRKRRLGSTFKGIRLRLALALAVALAPVLLLSALQSRAAFRAEEVRIAQDLLAVSANSAHAAQLRIDRAVTGLNALRVSPDVPDCTARLTDLVEDSDLYSRLARIDRSGRIQCASEAPSVSSVADRPWFQALRTGRQMAFSAAPEVAMSAVPAVVVAVRRESASGRFDGALVAVVPITDLQVEAMAQSGLPGEEVALVDATGRVLATSDPAAFPATDLVPADLTDRLVRTEGQRGEARVMTATAFAGNDLFVVASEPSQGLFRWAIRNAVAVIMLPLLAWLAALVSVMVVTERFIVRWLSYLERIAAIHARGRHSVRPVHAVNAPDEIRALAGAMDEMVLAIAARDASLRESLSEKDALMREIHHRVKNNLQVITSLLNMQQRALTDAAARAAMSDTRQRITALALIYRSLYLSETLKQVDVAIFLHELVAQLLAADSRPGPPLDCSVRADPLIVDPDKLAPVALWAVEAISNAQKHAFASGGGRLAIRFVSGSDVSVLEVEDDGPGLSPGQPFSGLGRTLMTAFSRQLRGETEILESPSGGVLARLTFPTPEVSLELLTDSAGRRNRRVA